MKKLVFVSLAAVMASFAASADTIVTSKTYVDTKMQSKMATGSANEIPVYTGSLSDTNAPTFSPRAIHSGDTYTAGTDANKIPTMGAVMAQINNSASTVLPTGTSNQMLQHNGTSWTAVSIDTAPTADHTQPVTSGGVYTALSGKYDASNPSGYQANVLEGVQVAGTDQQITNKKVNLGAAAGKGAATTVSSTSTDSDVATAKAVYDAVNVVQTQVTALQNCKHECADSDCTLINVTCVDAYNPA